MSYVAIVAIYLLVSSTPARASVPQRIEPIVTASVAAIYDAPASRYTDGARTVTQSVDDPVSARMLESSTHSYAYRNVFPGISDEFRENYQDDERYRLHRLTANGGGVDPASEAAQLLFFGLGLIVATLFTRYRLAYAR
jgi:hypothetical protein